MKEISILLIQAETEIRRQVKYAYFNHSSPSALTENVRAVIEKVVSKTEVPRLRSALRRGLGVFFLRQREGMRLREDRRRMLLLLLAVLADRNGRKVSEILLPPQTDAARELHDLGHEVCEKDGEFYIDGVPGNTYGYRYFNRYVKPVFDRLLRDEPKDPDDISGRNSLRNRAEMEVRYAVHLRQIEELRQSGERLVVASSHADCSKRCFPWQGRVYSLDGTYGTTVDGRSFVPLETATDIYYTTKAGVRYKNGLLGFNCRHFLEPYRKGKRPTRISKAEAEREYRITEKQRQLERKVREWRIKSDLLKDVDKHGYSVARAKAKQWQKRYADYSHENRRRYHPARTKIL